MFYALITRVKEKKEKDGGNVPPALAVRDASKRAQASTSVIVIGVLLAAVFNRHRRSRLNADSVVTVRTRLKRVRVVRVFPLLSDI